MKKNTHSQAQCVVRAILKDLDNPRHKIFPVAVYTNKPAIFKTKPIAGYAMTDQAPFGIMIKEAVQKRNRFFLFKKYLMKFLVRILLTFREEN